MKKSFSFTRSVAIAGIGILLAGTVLTSCLKDNDNNDGNNNQAAGLMAFNLAPSRSTVGFAISGNNLTSAPLAFNNYTGAYFPIYPGSRSVEAYNFYSGNMLATATGNFELSKYYSVFLVGTDSTLENVIVRDNFDSLSTSTQAFVRYINAIPGSSGATVTISSGGTNVVNEGAAYKSVSQFVPVDAGSVTINITNGGNVNASRTVTLEQQKIYTVLLIGTPGGTGDTAPQVKFVVNGVVDNTAGRMSKSAGKNVSN